MSSRPEHYQAFQQFLERECGIVLGEGKQYLVDTRLSRLMRDGGYADLGQLVNKLTTSRDSSLVTRVVDAMTTNETLWFRDEYPFEALRKRILPEFETRGTSSVKIWSAACSSGQEPYSISMIFEEYKSEKPACRLNLSITATDISETVLAAARAGRYDDIALGRGLSDARRTRFFDRGPDGWTIKPPLRSRVTFSFQNLLGDFTRLGRFDIIFCRNVLIYFSRDTKATIINRMAACLNPGGYLILGASESLNQISDRFEMVRLVGGGIIHRLKG
ncbi:MAG: protein-glutamate O-methyltransferase CheR [Halothiobacillaceae bacterium]|nr:protein-glutamate O-methyltransferase CheR [Halothiobacillaceae bacterium]